mmetsp:Transcript_5078/g.9564  ORF Transcript_5078/g.9564 Transcript_5078/m.9564 type:complete len:770 (-) Transcript_5078:69-2378(-)
MTADCAVSGTSQNTSNVAKAYHHAAKAALDSGASGLSVQDVRAALDTQQRGSPRLSKVTAQQRLGVDCVHLEQGKQLDIMATLEGRAALRSKSGIKIESKGGAQVFQDRIEVGDFVTSVNEHEVKSVQDVQVAVAGVLSEGENDPVFLGFERHPTNTAQEYDANTCSLWSSIPRGHDESVLLATHAVHLREFDAAQPGRLFLSSYRVMFRPTQGDTRGSMLPVTVIVPILAMFHIQLQHQCVVLHVKDMRDVRFELSDITSAQKTYHQLADMMRSDPVKRAFTLANLPSDLDGWAIYDAKEEYRRMGVHLFPHLEVLEQSEYEICASYPRVLVVPSSCSKEELNASARFRSSGRLPVVTWVCKSTGNVLARCAQPLTGLRNVNCWEDERVVALLMTGHDVSRLAKTQPLTSKPGEGMSHFVSGVWNKVNIFVQEGDEQTQSPGVTASCGDEEAVVSTSESTSRQPPRAPPAFAIMDARSQIASMANQMIGKGTENPANYPGADLRFQNIDNIHTLRACWDRLRKLIVSPVQGNDLYKTTADTGWLKQVASVLVSSVELAKQLQTTSALTHCSDGWDRTAQMCSLAMLMLDPFYRTCRGFAVLVEKEWCSFGHKFRDRIGNESVALGAQSEERSPVFILWVDCVWQLLVQHQDAFEYNQDMLIALVDYVLAGRFGTFFYNTERERRQHGCHLKSGSVWSQLLLGQNARGYRNPHYSPVETPVFAHVAPRCLRLWESLYLRFDEFTTAAVPMSIARALHGPAFTRDPPNFS